jgi:hypothetical protein
MDHKFVVRSERRSGGLILFWKKEVGVELTFKCKNYIDVTIGRGLENIWRLTGVYGEPRWEDKHLTWQRLRDLHAQSTMPWLVIGDFNEILHSYEKEGGNPRSEHFMQAFQSALVDCKLLDLGYRGDKFTWHRGLIRERLDRALVNEAWKTKFEGAFWENLPYNRSDHRPLLLCFEEMPIYEENGPSILRFEARWLKEARFKDIVKEAWENSASSNVNLAGRLSKIHSELHNWDRNVLQRKGRNIKSAQKELERVSIDALTAENIAKQKEIALEIENLLEQEEILWAQRSRINWLQFGDRNTNYFHNFANARRQRNQIKKLKDDQGNWLEGTAYLNPMISDYFSGLFSTEVYDTDPSILEKVIPRVTTQMNEALQAPFSAEDVRKALFSIGDMKAPSTDGLHAIFFKKC